MTQFTTGTRVRVTAAGGGLFYSGNKGKVGAVTRTSRAGEIVHVRFDDGAEDYGRPADLEVVTMLGAPAGIVVGSKVKVTRAIVFMSKYEGETGEVYRVDGRTIYVQFANGRDYGMIDELELVAAAKDANGFISNAGNSTGKLPAPRGTKLDVLYNDGTLILDLPIGDGTSKRASNNSNSYSATTWTYSSNGSATIKAYRFPADRPGVVASLDDQLSALRTELEAVKAEKIAAEAEVKAAQTKVDAVEARRIALVGRLAKHGIQFIGESVSSLTGLQAHEAGILKLGTKLLTVTTADSSEHTDGREYAIIRVDAHDSACTYKLESNDGYGFWLSNEQLTGYTVVA